MTHLSERYLKTGDDPRTLPDYAALRDELAKLAHPARPDVNWRYAEKLCLSLFEQNGVELQSAAWYTLARMQLAGLFGLNEGLAILEALICHQWAGLWPHPVHARMEILSGLSQRIQQMMRTLPLGYSDLGQLYLAEQQFTNLGAALQRLELKHLSQFDTLRTLMHNSAVRLENSDGAAVPAIVLPVDRAQTSGIAVEGLSAVPTAAKNDPANTTKWVYVVPPERQRNVEVVTDGAAPTSGWKPFVSGMFAMLIAGSAALSGWHFLLRPNPLVLQLEASVAPFPAPLSSAELQVFRQSLPVPATVISDTQQQLTRLQSLPQDWPLNYGQQLVRQAAALLPEDTSTRQLTQAWQQKLTASALPVEAMNGWHQGMEKLQQLSRKLSGLDEQRGKYMTVSELKSVVYSTTQAFNRAIPAEEQLRRYAASASDIEQRQVEMALEQLQKRYFLLRQEQGEAAEAQRR